MAHRDPDIVIIGGGIAGTTLACALGGSSLQLLLVDEGPKPLPRGSEYTPYDNRVSAINIASERLFGALGAWEQMVAQRVSPFVDMRVEDEGNQRSLNFDSGEIGASHLGHIIENQVITSALAARAAACDNIELRYSTRVDHLKLTPQQPEIEIDGEVFTPQLVVGADGGHSAVREATGIAWLAKPYHQNAIVTTIRARERHAKTAWQRFLKSGPLAFLPLCDGQISVVWSLDDHLSQEVIKLDEDAFIQHLSIASDHYLQGVIGSSPRKSFPLASGYAERYIGPKTVLIGDAAHQIHPLAGQGANMGILDAGALAEIILGQNGSLGGIPQLRRYERWRRGDSLITGETMTLIKALFTHKSGLITGLRGEVLHLIDQARPLKRRLIRQASGVAGDLPKLAIKRRLMP